MVGSRTTALNLHLISFLGVWAGFGLSVPDMASKTSSDSSEVVGSDEFDEKFVCTPGGNP